MITWTPHSMTNVTTSILASQTFLFWVATSLHRLLMVCSYPSWYAMLEQVPNIRILFWELGVFQISFSVRDTFVTDWHRHWGSSTVDMGNSSYTMMSRSPEWWMIFCYRPFEPSNQRLYYISSEMEVTGCDNSTELKRRVLHASRRCWLFLGTWSHSHIGSSLLFMRWRFLFVCLGSCFILILYVFGLWFSDLSILNYISGYGHCPYLSFREMECMF